MFRLALGDDPRMPRRAGPYAMAAKWYYRWFTDGVVGHVPSPEDIARIERETDGVRFDVVTQGGTAALGTVRAGQLQL